MNFVHKWLEYRAQSKTTKNEYLQSKNCLAYMPTHVSKGNIATKFLQAIFKSLTHKHYIHLYIFVK